MRSRELNARNPHASVVRQLTIRNVSPDLDRALRLEQRRRGTSLNETVLDLLRRSLGLGSGRRYDNGLGKLAGTWTDEDLRSMEERMALFEQVDPELWS